jgi:nucleotidyltransferase/DNA polymerase involved in DNA repair
MQTCYWPRAILHIRLEPRLNEVKANATLLSDSRHAHMSMVNKALGPLFPELHISDPYRVTLEITHCQRRLGSPEYIAYRAHRRLLQYAERLRCTVGVAANRPVAEFAAASAGGDGVSVIAPWETQHYLEPLPVAGLWPLDERLRRYLELHDVRSCGDVTHLSLDELTRHCGESGSRLWHLCHGRDPEGNTSEHSLAGGLTQSSTLPPFTTSRATLNRYLRSMCNRLASRLQRHGQLTETLEVRLLHNRPDRETVQHYQLSGATNEGMHLYEWAKRTLSMLPRNEPVTEIRLSVGGIKAADGQLELFGMGVPLEGAG